MTLRASVHAAAAIAAICLLPWSDAGAEEVRIGGHVLLLEPEAGFCPLDRDRPDEGAVFAALERANGHMSRVLTIQVACEKLDAFRAGHALLPELTPAVTVTAPLLDGSLAVQDMPRARYAEAMNGALSGMGATEYEESAKDAGAVLAAVLRSKLDERYADFAYLGARYLGVLGHDDLAAYIGEVPALSVGGMRWSETAVSAFTLVDGVGLTVTYSVSGDRSEALGPLIARVREITRDLIERNEGEL